MHDFSYQICNKHLPKALQVLFIRKNEDKIEL